jgi:PPE-repeat protein
MFAGPGAGPLLAAAAAWNALAEELASSAASFGSVTSELVSGSWLGPSSAAMMAVAAQYAGWLRTAATHAEGAAGQAAAVAGAFEAALTAAVQPAVVAANRGLVQVLAATNWLGQNAPAIADIEAAYEQMWAMDVAAMSGYHADASASLSQLPSWGRIPAGLDIDNPGYGNLGKGNLGGGNSGDHNVGFGNIGIGNSGTGNIGLFNSGTGNMGILDSGALNTGLGNIGSSDLGFLNAGSGQTGWMNQSTQSINSLFGSDNVTGALNAASLNKAMLDSASLVTGGHSPDLASAGLVNSSLASTLVAAPAATPISGLAPVTPSVPISTATSAAGSTAAPSVAAPSAAITGPPAAASVRNNSTNSGGNPGTNSGNSVSGLRNTPARDAQDVPADGIRSSVFFDKLTAARVGSAAQQSGSSD